MNLTLWWIKPLAIGLVIFLCLSVAYYKGYEHEKVKLDTFKAQVSAQATIQEAKNKLLTQEQAKVTSDIILDRDKSLKQLKDYYETHNRILTTHSNGVFNYSSSSEVSSIPSATIKLDAIPEGNQPSADGIEAITAEQCAEDVLQLLTLQQWINKQSQLKD